MIPYEIAVLLWHYITPLKHPEYTIEPYILAVNNLGRCGLIEAKNSSVANDDSGLVVTEKGCAYVQALKDVPLPVQKWVVEKS